MSTTGGADARQYVLRTAKENDVKFIRLWFTDILGNLKGFAITDAELESALEDGMAFDGSTVEGFARHDEADMVAMPDPTTFSVLPWRPRQNAVARMFCDVLRPDGTPFEGDSRFVLKRALERAEVALKEDLGKGYRALRALEKRHAGTQAAVEAKSQADGIWNDPAARKKIEGAATSAAAGKLLRSAKNYLSNNMKPIARKKLEEVMRKFPGSPEARDAKKLLLRTR